MLSTSPLRLGAPGLVSTACGFVSATCVSGWVRHQRQNSKVICIGSVEGKTDLGLRALNVRKIISPFQGITLFHAFSVKNYGAARFSADETSPLPASPPLRSGF